MGRVKYFVVIGLVLLFAWWLAKDTRKSLTKEETIFVGSQMVECTAEVLQRCFQVKKDGVDEYEPFSGEIKGFAYQPGYEYELSVEVVELEDPSQGVSPLNYSLVDIIAKTEKPYIQIENPTTNQPIDTTKQFTISGKGRGLFENNVVIEIKDSLGATWGPTPTTMVTEEVGGEGKWEILINALNTPADTHLTIRAYSQSPKDGTVAMEDIVTAIAKPASIYQLESGRWELVSYQDPENKVTEEILPGTKITAEFIKGDVSGSAGCNNYFATYTTDRNGSLDISPAGSTLMACPEPILQQEIKYLANLDLVAFYAIEGSILTMLDKNNEIILAYEMGK